MNKKQKEETIEVFAEAFHEVVVPVVEELKEDIKKLDDKVESINRSLIQITDHQANKLDNNEKRIKKLEVKTRFAA